MKTYRGNRLLLLLSLGIMICILASCAAKKPPYEISKNYNKQKYKRVGLLVVRVGNYAHRGCPVPITLNTDYANRKPQADGGFNLTYPGNHVAKVDVYIEDEDRLRQSLPTYPDYPLHGLSEKVKYFKNITPRMYKTVSGLLAQKGYQVVNVKEVAATWPKKISEMKVGDIVDALKKDADAVLVMHYADVGYYYSSIYGVSQIGTYKSAEIITNEFKGFVTLNYAIAMFDANSRESLMHFELDSPYLNTIPRAISLDPAIKNNPDLAKKVAIEGKRNSSNSSAPSHDNVSLSFSEEETVDIVLGYVRHGIDINSLETGKESKSDWGRWIGLDEVIP